MTRACLSSNEGRMEQDKNRRESGDSAWIMMMGDYTSERKSVRSLSENTF